MKYLFLSISLVIGSFLSAGAQKQLDYLDTLSIGGIGQVISVKGMENSPVLLFIHGGPGSSRMNQTDIYTTELQKKFIVVQWDQREAGRTQQLNKSPLPITLQQMEQDTHDVVDSLRTRFNQTKIYLAGESWGTVLGFYMAAHYPHWLHAYLAISSVIDQEKSEKKLISFLKKQATASGNTVELEELNSVKVPFENYRQIYYSRKWLFHYDGQAIADKDTSLIIDYLRSWADTWLPVWNEAIQRNLYKTLPKIKCPVYFFVGGKDRQTDFEIARGYYKKLSAPKKDLFFFENAGHSLLTTEAAEVQKIIMDRILTDTKK